MSPTTLQEAGAFPNTVTLRLSIILLRCRRYHHVQPTTKGGWAGLQGASGFTKAPRASRASCRSSSCGVAHGHAEARPGVLDRPCGCLPAQELVWRHLGCAAGKPRSVSFSLERCNDLAEILLGTGMPADIRGWYRQTSIWTCEWLHRCQCIVTCRQVHSLLGAARCTVLLTTHGLYLSR